MTQQDMDRFMQHLQKTITKALRKHDHIEPLFCLVELLDGGRHRMSVFPWCYKDEREKYALVNRVRLLVLALQPAMVGIVSETWEATGRNEQENQDLMSTRKRPVDFPQRRETVIAMIQTPSTNIITHARLYRERDGDESSKFDRLGPWEPLDGQPIDIVLYPP